MNVKECEDCGISLDHQNAGAGIVCYDCERERKDEEAAEAAALESEAEADVSCDGCGFDFQEGDLMDGLCDECLDEQDEDEELDDEDEDE